MKHCARAGEGLCVHCHLWKGRLPLLAMVVAALAVLSLSISDRWWEHVLWIAVVPVFSLLGLLYAHAYRPLVFRPAGICARGAPGGVDRQLGLRAGSSIREVPWGTMRSARVVRSFMGWHVCVSIGDPDRWELVLPVTGLGRDRLRRVVESYAGSAHVLAIALRDAA